MQVEHFSKRFPGMTVEDGYAISRAWVKTKLAEGRTVKGHKIGLTSRAMQIASQIDEPDYGTLLDDMLYTCTPETAEPHLDGWLQWASRSKLPPFVRLARTLRRYRDGVLAAIRLGVSNARLEGFNNKIGVLKRRSFGFHTAAAFISMIFLVCANLPIRLPI